MELYELGDLIHDLGLDPTQAHLDLLYAEFERDFVNNPFQLDGLNVKVVLKQSATPGYEGYPETFVHLITRKVQSNRRMFDRHRANKIHWIRCILENRGEEEIIFFQYPEDDGKLRDYYWYKDEGFLVIMQKIAPNCLVITSFHIDNQRNEEYYRKRYQWYLDNRA
jgi:hypothetical protein